MALKVSISKLKKGLGYFLLFLFAILFTSFRSNSFYSSFFFSLLLLLTYLLAIYSTSTSHEKLVFFLPVYPMFNCWHNLSILFPYPGQVLSVSDFIYLKGRFSLSNISWILLLMLFKESWSLTRYSVL